MLVALDEILHHLVSLSLSSATLSATSFITFRAALSKTMLAASELMPSARRKYSCVQERIKVAKQSKKQVKSKNIASRLTQNSFATPS
jgi:hypothetical protein